MTRCILLGNPNVGKSTLFNLLTKGKQKVGNWPGKTVECKEGVCRIGELELKVLDLPGAYSTTPYSEEEKVVVEALLKRDFDLIIQVADATNLERNLYLTLELLQFTRKIVVALNKSDALEEKGKEIDTDSLEESFGVPFVKVSAKKGNGVERLFEKAIAVAEGKSKPERGKFSDIHSSDFEKQVGTALKGDKRKIPAKWLAHKLVQNDPDCVSICRKIPGCKPLLEKAAEARKNLEKISRCNIDTIVARNRYRFIESSVKNAMHGKSHPKVIHQIDNLLLNPWLGILIFLLVLWAVFQLSFTLSAPFSDIIGEVFSLTGKFVSASLAGTGAPDWLPSLINKGALQGIGSILVFTPSIFILFFLLYLLEDSGYMSRVAVVMDRVMHKAGLSGKSFIPFILGFGCNVPAIMSTRTLSTHEDRLATMLSIPFLSCSARLPIYLVFTGVFFQENQGLVLLGLYLLGALIALLTAFLIKVLSRKGTPDLLIELPRYHFPSLKAILPQVRENTLDFVNRAGTIILATSLLIWFLGSLPYGVEYGSEESFAGQLGNAISPIFAPLGFGSWQPSVSLLLGFIAKESVVSVMATSYSIDEGGLSERIAQDFTPLSALSFMVFALLYVPCMAVLATLKAETRSWKITLMATTYYVAIAWVVAFLVYSAGTYFGFG